MVFMDGASFSWQGHALYITRSGYTGEDGFEISLHQDGARALAEALLAQPEVMPIGLGARNSLRPEAGLCLYGNDMDAATTPLEAQLMWAVQKVRREGGARAGGFIGAEALFAQMQRGAGRVRVGLRALELQIQQERAKQVGRGQDQSLNDLLLTFSEQQLVDCSVKEGNQGCNGGLMDYGFQYIIDNKGLTSEAAYPYSATGPNTCVSAGKPVVAKISGFKDVPTNSEVALMTAIAHQPVSVAVEANQNSFQFYKDGVMTQACGSNLDHGVLAVGYGTLGGKDYYLVKNSWGTSWGKGGYILLGRGSTYGGEGQCGIQMDPSYPVI
jgi:hypothetical protein